MDILGSLAAMPLLVPIVLLMLVVTRLWAPGPVFFRQERVGFNGRRFTLFKFRTMKAGASSAAHQAHALEFIRNNRPMDKLDNAGDPRLIPLGRILRATGLDELPQIVNVLLGDMTLVGPRPCIPYEFEAYQPWQKERFRAMPGITGLWQVSGKNRLSFDEMIRLDIDYARKLRFSRDLTIIVRTVPALVDQVRDARRARLAAAAPTLPELTPALSDYRSAVVTRDARRQLYQFRFPQDVALEPEARTRENA